MSEKHKLWGGAFSESPDELAWRFGQSIQNDLNLVEEEIWVCEVHTRMLARVGLISKDDCRLILAGLEQLTNDVDWHETQSEAEDIHSAVATALEELIGSAAQMMTSARSRNDQIATVSRLWITRACTMLRERTESLQQTLLLLGKEHATDPLCGMTHMQAAQPITLGYHLMTYFWMLERDKERLDDTIVRSMSQCPLGSGALAGTTLTIDRNWTSDELGFTAPSQSALDSVSDRDFFADFLHSQALIMQHLSRLAQDLVLWATPQFGYVAISDAYSTGSSLMPQKRNPDIAELIRGRAAVATGAYTSLMALMQGLPLAYNRDMQDDKPGAINVFKVTFVSVRLMDGMLRTAKFDTRCMAVDAANAGATATDVAEQFVREGVPFRVAHERVGKMVKEGTLPAVSAAESIQSRNSQGGPAPEAFQAQLAAAEALLTPSV